MSHAGEPTPGRHAHELRRRSRSDRSLAEGGDWVLVGPDGLGRIDVRGQWLTEDGASIFVRYRGLIEMNAAVGRALQAGEPTRVGDQYLRIVPEFETGDERYA
ncbi:MAG: DUF3237 family protein [Thermocrispum sp.]